MRRTLMLLSATALLALAALPARGTGVIEPLSSRVIVSTTLNSTLQFFDATSLAQTQPPLPSKGLGPVRLWVDDFDGKPILLAANHGAVNGSVGAFDLSADIVTELPLSPFPARPGSVGIVAGTIGEGEAARDMVFITNTWFALGPCEMPAGSVTAYDASLLGSVGLMTEVGTVTLSGAVPYAVAVDEANDRAYASVNCTGTLETIDIDTSGMMPTVSAGDVRPSGDGADGSVWDPVTSLTFTTNISGNNVVAHTAISPGPATSVSLPGARPIELTLADSPHGQRWLITANGGNDTVSIIDRQAMAVCVLLAEADCDFAHVATIATGVAGGAPEGVAYDPVSHRIFVVNKPVGAPSLTVIQLTEPGPTGVPIATIPLNALGADPAPAIPALIAFDVAVQQR